MVVSVAAIRQLPELQERKILINRAQYIPFRLDALNEGRKAADNASLKANCCRWNSPLPLAAVTRVADGAGWQRSASIGI